MTRIDLTTREWHELISPVLPHASTDKDEPHLSAIRIEIAERAIFAIATDRSTLAAERHHIRAERIYDPPEPIHIHASDAAASLKLFTFSKDEDPPLTIIIDEVFVAVPVVGEHRSVKQLAITLQDGDGTRLVLHDHRDPSMDPLGGWRRTLAGVWDREQAAAAPALSLNAAYLPRWGKAVRKGERLCVFTGTKESDLVLLVVEQHFAGVWKPVAYLDSPAQMLAESPWRDELDGDDE